jgi:hypothetical protein
MLKHILPRVWHAILLSSDLELTEDDISSEKKSVDNSILSKKQEEDLVRKLSQLGGDISNRWPAIRAFSTNFFPQWIQLLKSVDLSSSPVIIQSLTNLIFTVCNQLGKFFTSKVIKPLFLTELENEGTVGSPTAKEGMFDRNSLLKIYSSKGFYNIN